MDGCKACRQGSRFFYSGGLFGVGSRLMTHWREPNEPPFAGIVGAAAAFAFWVTLLG